MKQNKWITLLLIPLTHIIWSLFCLSGTVLILYGGISLLNADQPAFICGLSIFSGVFALIGALGLKKLIKWFIVE